MGGYGSGRRDGKPLAEECKRIELGWMLRTGKLMPGCWGKGRLTWTCDGEDAGWIGYEYDMTDPLDSWMELRFTAKRYGEAEGRKYVQRVRLSFTEPSFGGRRWWMHCPLTGRRVGKLYCPLNGEQFASRAAWGVAYRSQRSDHAQRPFDALFRLQRKLGCREGWEGFIRRPKGMWRRTYDRHEQRYWELGAHCAAIMVGKLALLRGM